MPAYYLDPFGNKKDADIHDQILAAGDGERATEVSREVMRRLGFTEEQIAQWLPRAVSDEEVGHQFHGNQYGFGRGDRVESPHGPGTVTSAIRRSDGYHHFVRHDTAVENQVGRMYHESELAHAASAVRPPSAVSAEQELRRRVATTTPEQRERLKGMSRAEIVREANAAATRRKSENDDA